MISFLHNGGQSVNNLAEFPIIIFSNVVDKWEYVTAGSSSSRKIQNAQEHVHKVFWDLIIFYTDIHV